MPQSSIHVIAHLVSFPNKIEETKALLFGLLEPTHQEAGCLQFDLMQNQEDPTDFRFIEEWESLELMENHLASEHIQAAVAQFPQLLAQPPDIRRFSHIV